MMIQGQLSSAKRMMEFSRSGAAPSQESGLAAVVFEPKATVERSRVQQSLADDGVRLPLPHHWTAGELSEWSRPWLVAVRDGRGRYRSSVPVFVRSAPLALGHRVLRAERFGAGMSPEDIKVAARALARLALSDARNLRLDVEVFSRDPAVHAACAEALEAAGLSRRTERNRYADTLVVDLTPDEEKIFAGFSSSARRNIRQVAKHPVTVKTVSDQSFAPRLNELVREALERTGGKYVEQRWEERIAFSERYPKLSRIIGLFRNDVQGPESLVAFAWGCFHGDHAQYNDSGSVRVPELKVAMAYPLLWDLMQWGKRSGAQWFDMGGVTPGTEADGGDPLGGISDFKRFFSQQIVRVGEEWVLHPKTVRARLAGVLHLALCLAAGFLSSEAHASLQV